MSVVKRTHTWEISDSENESEEIKPSSSSDVKGCGQDAACSSSTGRTHDTSGGRRRRRTAAGEKQREETERRKEEKRQEQQMRKEEKRQEQQRRKEEKRQEQQRRKEEKRQEQQRRKEAAERLNLLRPENLIKSLTIHIHAVLLQDSGCDLLLKTLDGLDWRNRIEDQSLHSSISWTRQAEENDVEEDQILMVISHNEFNEVVMSHKNGTNQSAPVGEVNEKAESLLQSLSEYSTKAAGKVLTVLVISQHQRAGSWDGDDIGSYLDHQNLDTEELLVHLQLYWNVAVYFLFGWEEVTDHVIAVTKALAKRPYRALSAKPPLGFCMDGSRSGGVRADRDGRGLAQVWTRQIQQLNRVSEPTAKSVTAAYPSPSLLLQAYDELPSEEERRRLLADLPVGGGAKERRVGPDISSRIYRLVTSKNPHLLLD